MLPPQTIIPWLGNNGDIPSGLTRDTNFDGRLVKAVLANSVQFGGNATHTHTVNHVHTIAPHTHTVDLGTPTLTDSRASAPGSSQQDLGHSHPNSTTGTSGNETTGVTTVNFSSNSNLPPYFDFIFLINSAWKLIPENSLILRVSARDGLTFHSASENRFLRGADAGQDAGGTGGNATHSHTQSHTHTPQAHSHITGYTAPASPINRAQGGSYAGQIPPGTHSHSISVNASTQNLNANTDNSSTENLEPLHKTVQFYLTDSDQVIQPGDIILCPVDYYGMPVGFQACDGTNGSPALDNFYIKNNSTPNIIGGANRHAHSFNHIHTGNGTHTHTGASAYTGYSGSGQGTGTVGDGQTVNNHVHRLYSAGSTTANYAQATLTTTEADNQPPFITMQFIMCVFNPASGGGSVIPALL